MSNDPAISVANVTKVYKLYDSPQHRLKEALHPFRRRYHRDFHALNGISFEIPKGETVGIIGQNGAGKSTLLKVVTGVLTPTTGSVSVNGRISALLELGAGFNPEITGLENVYFNGTLLGFSRDEIDAKLDDILSFADIGDFITQPVKIYSSGMFIRLAFAVAIHADPDVLIVDEALSVGDVMFQSKCFDKIKSLMERGITTLFVAHNMNTITSLCSRAIMLDAGNVYADGSPKDVTHIYYELQRKREHEKKEREKARQKEGAPTKPQSSLFRTSKLDQEYRFGLRTAEITDFQITDHKGQETLTLETGETFSVRMRIQFHEDVSDPAFGMIIRNPQGQNLLGVHSYHQKRMSFGPKKKGEVLFVTASSTMLLNPGKYLISLSIAEHATDFEYLNIDARTNAAAIDVVGDKAVYYGLVNNPGEIFIEELTDAR